MYTPDGTAQDSVVNSELLRISQVLNDLTEDVFTIYYAEPEKPRVGMVKNADGVEWNPGGGAGLYFYNGNQWILLSSQYNADESLAYFLDY
jgi:hypothetical protein